MARKQSSTDLQAQIAMLIEKKREAERQEKIEAKQAEEKLALKLGRIVLDFQKAGFTGFNKTDFVKQVEELVAGSKKDVPATAANTAQGSDVQGSNDLQESAADSTADVADTGALEAGTETAEATTDIPAEPEKKNRMWG